MMKPDEYQELLSKQEERHTRDVEMALKIGKLTMLEKVSNLISGQPILSSENEMLISRDDLLEEIEKIIEEVKGEN